MKVLHLFADWKWTGPSEPTLDLCLELRALGVEVALACPPAPPEAKGSLPERARARGLDPIHDFLRKRSLNPIRNFAEIRALAETLREWDVVHVHSSHDHILGGLAARRSRHARVLRTNHKAVPARRDPATSYLYRRLTDGYLTFSQAALEADRKRFPKLQAWHVDPAMRLDRFTPREASHEGFAVGVVARMQRHRRFNVLLEGVRRARVPDLRVIVVGRGTHMNEVAVEPARRLGLTNVAFTGYLGDAYLHTLAGFDALLFLVPGSDGTCRAIREAMAMGKAVIGARRGMIPELVDDGETGLVIDDTPDNIARAIERLAADRPACRLMGAHGREKALRLYDIRRQAATVRDIYTSLCR